MIRTHELKADEERVKGLIEEMASAYEDPTEVIEFYGKNKELMDNMRNVALEEQAVEAVLAKAKVSEKATTFSELMNQPGVSTFGLLAKNSRIRPVTFWWRAFFIAKSHDKRSINPHFRVSVTTKGCYA